MPSNSLGLGRKMTSYFAPRKRTESTSKASSPLTVEGISAPPSSRKRGDDISSSPPSNHDIIKRAKIDDSVQEMIKYLDVSNSEGACWRTALDKQFSSKGFGALAKFVSKERISATVYPPPCDVFSALTSTPLGKVKVVIVGQDPYHGPGQGHGLCFSVRKGIGIPPSLKNIYRELKSDPKVDFPRNGGAMPTHGHLERWAKQGVLMLNTVLTVRKGEANSHKRKGWEEVTDEILRVLEKDCQRSGRGLVFLLWGKPASKKIESVLGQASMNRVVISTSHPSPLGAAKTASPFLGSRCFSRANEALIEKGLDPVDWNVDDSLVDV